jgi:hypothetical protein
MGEIQTKKESVGESPGDSFRYFLNVISNLRELFIIDIQTPKCLLKAKRENWVKNILDILLLERSIEILITIIVFKIKSNVLHQV